MTGQKTDAQIKREKWLRLQLILNALKERPMKLTEIEQLFKDKQIEVSRRTIQNYLEELKELDDIRYDKTKAKYYYRFFPKVFSPQEYKLTLDHSNRLLSTSDELKHHDSYEGEVTPRIILDLMLQQKEDFGELFCLKQHFRTGYYDEFWLPFQMFSALMEKHNYPIVSASQEFMKVVHGHPTNAPEVVFGEVSNNDSAQLVELKKQLLITLYKIMIDVKHGAFLRGSCDHCPMLKVSITNTNNFQILRKTFGYSLYHSV